MNQKEFFEFCLKVRDRIQFPMDSVWAKKWEQVLTFGAGVDSLIANSVLLAEERDYSKNFLNYSAATQPSMPVRTKTVITTKAPLAISRDAYAIGYDFASFAKVMNYIGKNFTMRELPAFLMNDQKGFFEEIHNLIMGSIDGIPDDVLEEFYDAVCYQTRRETDVVIVAGGASPARAKQAAQLYSENPCIVITTGSQARYLEEDLPFTEAELSAFVAMDNKVPIFSIYPTYNHGHSSTQGNLADTTDYIKTIADVFGRELSITLVTSPFHTRRFYMEALDFFSNNYNIVDLGISGAPGLYGRSDYWVDGDDSKPTKKGSKGMGFILNEHLKIMYNLFFK